MDMSALNEIFYILAETLGVSLEYVRQNSRELILEFARYTVFKNFVTIFISSSFIYLVAAGFGTLLFFINQYRVNVKKVVTYFFAIGFILSLLIATGSIIPYFASPFMYGVENLLRLVK